MSRIAENIAYAFQRSGKDSPIKHKLMCHKNMALFDHPKSIRNSEQCVEVNALHH
jgi:hypothetical protein